MKILSTHRAPALRQICLSLMCLLPATWTQAFTIELDFTYDTNNFFVNNSGQIVNQTAVDALEAAASFFESVIVDQIDPIIATGGNSWTPTFTHPGDGTSFPPDTVTPDTPERNRVIPADTILVFAGARNISGSTIGSAGPGGRQVEGPTSTFAQWKATVDARGELNAEGTGATDFAKWGGALSFDTHTDAQGLNPRNWHFDHTTLPSSGQNDFFSVALHELGHVLGLGTSKSWDTYLATDGSGNNIFEGPASMDIFGNPVPLESGSDPSHWRNSGISPEPAMDPTITNGTRKVFTNLDIAGLQDVGWDIRSSGDLDSNGIVDAADIDTLAAAIRNNETQLLFDLDANAQVNQDDLTHLITVILGTLPGDANLDLEVDNTDYGLMLNRLNQNSGWQSGDFNGDGITNLLDYSILATNLSRNATTLTAAPTPLPEPTTALLLLGVSALVIRRPA